MWHPDKHLVEVTAKKRDELLAALLESAPTLDRADDSQRGMVLDLFETLGMRCFMRLQDIIPKKHVEALKPLASIALDAMDPEDLLASAEEIVLRAPELQTLEGDALAALEEQLVDCLSVRDRVELVLAGIQAVTGQEPDLPLELETAILTFGDLVKDDLWRLLPLGRRRAANVLWAEPSMRKIFWWWEIGMDLPHTALEDICTAARIIHLFPQAKGELERLVKAEDVLVEVTEEAGYDNVVPIRVAVRRRVEIASEERHARSLDSFTKKEAHIDRAAAATKERVVRIYQYPRDAEAIFTISSDGSRFILDIAPPHKAAPGKAPFIEVEGDRRFELVPRRGFQYRFELDLEMPPFDCQQGRLVVPLESEELTISLPFED